MSIKSENQIKKSNSQKIEFLARESLENKLVIFVGAGISMNCGLPSWNDLIEKFGEKLGEKISNSEDVLDIPELFYDNYGKVEYYRILNDTFNKKLKPHAIHETLKKLNPKYIVTTNYDSLIEDTLNDTGIYDVITQEKELAYSKKNNYIIKMHGDLKNKNIVLTRTDYDEYERNFPLITTFVKSLFTTNTVLFIGYSLNDQNVKKIMEWIKEILKDDFRKAYLIDLSKDTLLKGHQDKKNKTISKIYLDAKNSEYGTFTNDFLNSIYLEKRKIENLFKGNFYKEIPYITDDILKKIFNEKKIMIQFSSYQTDNTPWQFDKEILLKRTDKKEKISLNEIGLEEMKLILRSNIFKINGEVLSKNLIDNNENDNDIREYENIREKENEFINRLIKFDFKSCLNMIGNNEIKNPFLKAYLYFLKNDFCIAKEKIMEIIENESSPEKKLWAYFNMEKLENFEKDFFYLEEESIII